jgi:excisionase family DNA binding protein
MRLADALDAQGPDLSVRELAQRLECSERTIYRWIEDGALAGMYRTRGRIKIPQESVLAAIRSKTIGG